MRKMFLLLILSTIVATLTTLSRAQLSTGLVTTVGGSSLCPIQNSQGQPTGWIPGTLCQNATLTACSGADNINFTFGYENPTHGAYAGTVLFFSSAGGESPRRRRPPARNGRAGLPPKRVRGRADSMGRGALGSECWSDWNEHSVRSLPTRDFHQLGTRQPSSVPGNGAEQRWLLRAGSERGIGPNCLLACVVRLRNIS
jgi:hypothetical protein